MIASSIDASAQTPPPKTESELIAAGYKPISGASIGPMVTGNTSHGLILAPTGGAKAGDQYRIYYRDSKSRVTVMSQGQLAGKKFESNWWIEGNTICHEQRVGNVGHACYALYEVGSSIYGCLKPSGECNHLVRIMPGNPDKL